MAAVATFTCTPDIGLNCTERTSQEPAFDSRHIHAKYATFHLCKISVNDVKYSPFIRRSISSI